MVRAVRQIGNPVVTAYLQALLLTGVRREELAAAGLPALTLHGLRPSFGTLSE
jgi:hypothetical protein